VGNLIDVGDGLSRHRQFVFILIFKISALQSLKSPLMPTLAESGREESDHDNVISLTYSVPAGLMRSLQETAQASTYSILNGSIHQLHSVHGRPKFFSREGQNIPGGGGGKNILFA